MKRADESVQLKDHVQKLKTGFVELPGTIKILSF